MIYAKINKKTKKGNCYLLLKIAPPITAEEELLIYFLEKYSEYKNGMKIGMDGEMIIKILLNKKQEKALKEYFKVKLHKPVTIES